ncbi:MAG: hypothetical protein C5B54_10985 [Acidobacteria bacterium]|nr:MAG: hypothetical protein C5B54_10985 [Acidobacteriota bacterium]
MKFHPFLLLLLFVSSIAFAADSASIDSINFANPDPTNFIVQVQGKGLLNPVRSFMDNPPRIALDFADAKKKVSGKIEAKDNPFIYRVRTSEESKDKKKSTRVVIELKAPWNYSVTTVDGGVEVHLSVADQKKPATPAASAAPTTSKQNPAPAVPSADIVIGSEDLIEVNVFELPQFNVSARVSGDGTITMPLVGSIEVRGLTKKQAEQRIAQALESKYVNNANVSVYIKEYKSRQVSLLGAVKNPGAYFIISQRSLLQLLSEAGGLTTDAGQKCFIFRPNSPRIEVDLYELMINGDQDLNVSIYPGDVINVPPQAKTVVYVLGAVRTPGAVELITTMPVTLLAAIARAGGPAEQANQSGIQIRRKDASGKETVIKANLKDIISGKAEDIPLMAGDVINVPESFF